MRGLMQDRPLALPHLFHRAERLFGHKRLVTASANGETTMTYAEWADRVRRLATVFGSLGLSAEARVGTFCWNTQRHLELYFAVPCTGRVLHTLNIRLFAEQLVYIANHAEDEIVFVDRSLLPRLWPLVGELRTVRRYVVVDDGSDAGIPDDERVLDYERLLADAAPWQGRFEIADEHTAAAMCYTSGTTGNPKGVVYSHRSTVLHSIMVLTADAGGLSERDVVMPVVPMFHANAWGLPYSCVLAGSSIVFPGPTMTPEAVVGLLERHQVTVTAGVPTIWMGVLPLLAGRDLTALRMVLCGGSAVPRALSEGWRTAIGLPITQAWGMTETSPLASMATLGSVHADLDDDAKAAVRATQGVAVPLVDLRLADPESGEEMPWDDKATGELQAAGPWVASAYYRDEGGGTQYTEDGWLRTGDVAAVDHHGFVRLVDRTKDLVKSGGEWISSVELENEIMAHPAVAEAAVIAVAHPRWVERPVACVVVKPGERLTRQEVLDHLRPRVARLWLPDDVLFIDEVPKTSTGKFSKRTLREKFVDYQLPETAETGNDV